MSELPIGHMIEGRYRIDQHLAAGGQGHIYKGTHIILGRTVAIKTLRVHSQNPQDIARVTKRFEQEAILLSQLRDPHTITLYDFGKLQGGLLFMVFEFIEGLSLRELLADQGKLSAYRVAKILKQTLMSLQEAHTMGVLHRDIKPANIMIYEHAGRSDQVKLLDFGIAKALDTEEEEALTNVGNIVGTPRYIAPEIFRQVKPSVASDLYSLGLVAYEMLVGKPAIEGRRPVDIMRTLFAMTKSKQLPELPGLHGALKTIVETMLQIDISARYTQCAEVLFDLQYWDKPQLPGVHSTHQSIADDDVMDTLHDDDIPTTHFDPSQLPWINPEEPLTQMISSDNIPSIFSTAGFEAVGQHTQLDPAEPPADDDYPTPAPMMAEDGDSTMILTELPPVLAPAAILKRKKIKKHIQEHIKNAKTKQTSE